MDSRFFSAVIRLLSGNLNQSPDNPIQLDRLPDDSAVELDYPVFQDNRRTALRHIGVLVFLTTLIAPALAWFGRLIPIPYLSGGLYTAAALFAGTMIVLGLFGRWWPLGCYAVAAAVVPILIMLAHDVKPGLSALALAVGGTALLAVSLSTNYLFLRSAAPTPRDKAERIRELWQHRWWNIRRPMRGTELHVFDFLLLPIVATGLFLYFADTNGRSSLSAAAAVMLVVAVSAVVASALIELAAEMLYGRPALSLKGRWRAFSDALLEWVSYNRLNTAGVGVHRSTGGSCTSRQRLLVGVVAAWACLWAGFQSSYDHERSSFEARAARHREKQARIQQQVGTVGRARETGLPQFQAPELTTDEKRFAARLSPEARREYLEQRERTFLASANPKIDEIEDEFEYGRPATQLKTFVTKVGAVTVQALVPSLATLIGVTGLLFAMTSRSLAGVDATLSSEPRKRVLSTDDWEKLVARVQTSQDDIESECVLLGANARDDTPILAPRGIFREHAHILGDSGAGKTTIALMPLITQLMRFGDASVLFIDLKADKQYLFESLRVEAERVPDWVRTVRKEKYEHPDYPFRWFTTVLDRSSYAFNPLAQKVIPKLAPDQRTDIFTAALGLQYGTDYGRKYFGDANYEVLNYALRENPNISSLAELEQILAGASRFPLPEETKKAGTNVSSSVRRLARCKALNACAAAGTPQSVLDAAIDLDQLFTRPQALYFALPPAAGISNTAEIARTVLYLLLAAAQAHEGPRTQVYLIVDEFQRIVSNNVELFLQQARSMGIGCLFSNQSIGDLLKIDADLLSSVRTNTRFRQVLGAGDPEDIRDLILTSGETVQGLRTWSYTPGIFEATIKGLSISESVRERLSINDILKATDAPGRSITSVRRGDGYAQFGGMSFVMDSVYHISSEEFERREDVKWPGQTPDTVVATLADYTKPSAVSAQILGVEPRRHESGDESRPAANGASSAAKSIEAADGPPAAIDAGSAEGVSGAFLEALYNEQQQKAQAHLAKKKKKAKRNPRSDT